MFKKLLFTAFTMLCFAQVMAQEVITFGNPDLQHGEIMPIRDARLMPVGSIVTVKGIVTAAGTVSSYIRYFQDSTGAINSHARSTACCNQVSLTVQVGDSILVTGKLWDSDAGLLSISMDDSPEEFRLDILSRNNPLPDPRIINFPHELREDVESMLVRVDNITTADEREFWQGGGGDGTFQFFKETPDSTIFLRQNRPSNPLAGTFIPKTPVSALGVVNNRRGVYRISLRGAEDFVTNFDIFDLDQLNITTNSFELIWDTPLRSTSYALINKLGEDEVDSIPLAGEGFRHEIEFRGLDPAATYEVDVVSVSVIGGLIDRTGKIPYSTAPEGNRNITVYFNQPIGSGDASKYFVDEAFGDSIAAYIDKAMFSLDIAVSNLQAGEGSDKIIEAINNAYNRGIMVRYITDDQANKSTLDSLNVQMPLLVRNDAKGTMDNNFVIVDAQSIANARIIMTTSGWTPADLNQHHSNLIIINDQAVANAFSIEFEQMWGGSSEFPVTSDMTFGTGKQDLTGSRFDLTENNIEVYFNPRDVANDKIMEYFLSMDADFRFAIASNENFLLTSELIEYGVAGFYIKGIINNTPSQSSAELFNRITAEELDVNLYEAAGLGNELRTNYAIVDIYTDPKVIISTRAWEVDTDPLNGDDPVVNNNDATHIVINDAEIANLFLKHFRSIYKEVTGQEEGILTSTEDQLKRNVLLYPNPAEDRLFINANTPSGIVDVVITDLQGKTLFAGELNGRSSFEVDIAGFERGIYLARVTVESKEQVFKFIKQ
ncbi:MAG: T9SS type A sorting domain-containing protein [Bacteroidota bacterium]